jgi:peptide/nickel transport system substrate-binding protein
LKTKLILSLLILLLISVPLFAAACGGEEPPPAQQEEEEEEEEEEGDWWDKLGTPEYGGTITIPTSLAEIPWDAWTGKGYACGVGFQMVCENLFWWDWALDRDIWPFQTDFTAEEYMQGQLAESWELTDPETLTVNLRQGIHWQNKPPVNGREFVANDVAEHYHRLMGTDGYTEPNQWAGSWLSSVESVTATGKYTVVFKLTNTITGTFQVIDNAGQNTIVAPEAVAAEGGVITNWENCVGTGPWMITDFVAGSSITYIRNPDYWRYDERHPENQLPYADEVKYLNITDQATQLAAIRTGQVDMLNVVGDVVGCGWQQAELLKESDPELMQVELPKRGYTLIMAADSEPFTDIRVRKAMQLAINLPELAQTYYNGIVEGIPCGLVSPSYKGWYYPYDDWSQELKDEYSYNPTLARQLLDEAAQDGVFEVNDSGGFNTNIVTASTDDLELLHVLQSYLSDIGVNTEVQAMDPLASFAYCMEGNNDAFFFTEQTGNTWPPMVLIGARMSTDPRNITRCSDPVVDELYNDFFSAETMEEAKQALREADKRILEQHWAVYLFPIYIYPIYQPYLHGYSGEILGYHPGQVFARLWIDQAMKESMGR